MGHLDHLPVQQVAQAGPVFFQAAEADPDFASGDSLGYSVLLRQGDDAEIFRLADDFRISGGQLRQPLPKNLLRPDQQIGIFLVLQIQRDIVGREAQGKDPPVLQRGEGGIQPLFPAFLPEGVFLVPGKDPGFGRPGDVGNVAEFFLFFRMLFIMPEKRRRPAAPGSSD